MKTMGLFAVLASTFIVLAPPLAQAECKAPSKASLEQVGSEILFRMQNDGCSDAYFIARVSYMGFYTRWMPDPNYRDFTWSTPVLRIPATKEGLYAVLARPCHMENGKMVCAPTLVREEIYFVTDRDAYAKNWDMAWKVPRAGVDYPDDPESMPYLTSHVCASLQSRDCIALSTATDANGRGMNRLVQVPDGADEKPYFPFYSAYQGGSTYLKDLIRWYEKPGRDQRYLKRMIQGLIDSADFSTYKSTTRKFMVFRGTPDLYGNAADNGHMFKMMAHLLSAVSNPTNGLQQYRWTVLSLFRMMSLSFLVDYDYARGGLKTRTEPGNTSSGVTAVGNYPISFGGGFKLDPQTGRPYNPKLEVEIGKSLHAIRDLFDISWRTRAVPLFSQLQGVGIDLTAEYAEVTRYVIAATAQMAGPDRADSFTLKDMENAGRRSSSSAIPYGFKPRDRDWDTSDPEDEFVHVARTTTLTKACGGFGGYLKYSGGYHKLSGSDIGQIMGIYWMAFDTNLGDNALIPERGNAIYNRPVDQLVGWAPLACKSAAVNSDPAAVSNCLSKVTLLKSYFAAWRDLCCERFDHEVYVDRNGTKVKIESIPASQRSSLKEYPKYCQ